MPDDGSLAAALISLVADLEGPLLTLLSVVCWILGLVLFGIGMLRLLRHSDRFGPGAAPPAMGTAVTFVASAALIALPAWIDAASQSLFGAGAGSRSEAVLGYGGRGHDPSQLLGAVVVIVQLVGLVAIIRGLFVLRAAADARGPATTGAAAMHLVGGVAAWHITTLVDAVQTTLGIEVLTVS